jgi:hypothetical protein
MVLRRRRRAEAFSWSEHFARQQRGERFIKSFPDITLVSFLNGGAWRPFFSSSLCGTATEWNPFFGRRFCRKVDNVINELFASCLWLSRFDAGSDTHHYASRGQSWSASIFKSPDDDSLKSFRRFFQRKNFSLFHRSSAR